MTEKLKKFKQLIKEAYELHESMTDEEKDAVASTKLIKKHYEEYKNVPTITREYNYEDMFYFIDYNRELVTEFLDLIKEEK